MAVKYTLAILAVLNLVTFDQVRAAFNKVSNGVVRIELTKHFQPHHEIEDLEEDAEADGLLTIEIDNDYKKLRS